MPAGESAMDRASGTSSEKTESENPGGSFTFSSGRRLFGAWAKARVETSRNSGRAFRCFIARPPIPPGLARIGPCCLAQSNVLYDDPQAGGSGQGTIRSQERNVVQLCRGHVESVIGTDVVPVLPGFSQESRVGNALHRPLGE